METAPSYAAAVALSDLVPATGEEDPGRVVHGVGARPMARIGPLHGVAGGTTLCGLPVSDVGVLRQLFRPGAPDACPRCSDEARPAPGPSA